MEPMSRLRAFSFMNRVEVRQDRRLEIAKGLKWKLERVNPRYSFCVCLDGFPPSGNHLEGLRLV